MSKTKENKEIFRVCMEVLGAELQEFGYLPHPAYRPSWEAAHQEYECNWLKEDISEGIDEISLTWAPKEGRIRIARSLARPRLPQDIGFSDITSDPFEFNYFLENPYVRFTLMPTPRRLWQRRKSDLKLLRKERANPEEARKAFSRYVIPCLPPFLDARDGNIRSKSILVDSFDLR